MPSEARLPPLNTLIYNGGNDWMKFKNHICNTLAKVFPDHLMVSGYIDQ